MTKIMICGANGKMGQVLCDAAETSDTMCVIAGIDKYPDFIANDFPVYGEISDCREQADIIIDFSRPEALDANLSFAKQHRIPIVIATTGYSSDEKQRIEQASLSIPVFFAANMSLGVNLQMELSKKAAAFLGEAYDIEIIEKHHNQKVDSPSGTALAIADYINDAFVDKKEYLFGRCTKTEKRGKEIGIHGVRGGTITGEHNVMFIGTDEIIEVNHIAQSKQIFAYGALRAAAFLHGKPAGLYGMNDLIAQSAVTNIYVDDGQAMVTLADMHFSPKDIARVFDDVAGADVKIDIISQTAPHDSAVSLSFSMNDKDLGKCTDVLKKHKGSGVKLISKSTLSKLTVEGAGMKRQSGVASKLFGTLAKQQIRIYIISTSDTMISFCVDTDKARAAADVVATAFSL